MKSMINTERSSTPATFTYNDNNNDNNNNNNDINNNSNIIINNIKDGNNQ